MIDAAVRAKPEAAYDYAKLFRADPDRCKRFPHSPGAARSTVPAAACDVPARRTGSRRSGAAVAVTPNLAATYMASSSLVGRHPS